MCLYQYFAKLTPENRGRNNLHCHTDGGPPNAVRPNGTHFNLRQPWTALDGTRDGATYVPLLDDVSGFEFAYSSVYFSSLEQWLVRQPTERPRRKIRASRASPPRQRRVHWRLQGERSIAPSSSCLSTRRLQESRPSPSPSSIPRISRSSAGQPSYRCSAAVAAATANVRTNGFQEVSGTNGYSGDGSQFSAVSSNSRSFITQMSAVDRSNYLRAVRMSPYLQFMVGPLLRYDNGGRAWYVARGMPRRQ